MIHRISIFTNEQRGKVSKLRDEINSCTILLHSQIFYMIDENQIRNSEILLLCEFSSQLPNAKWKEADFENLKRTQYFKTEAMQSMGN